MASPAAGDGNQPKQQLNNYLSMAIPPNNLKRS